MQASPPVSYSRQVAAIFAMHCNVCHGEAGKLSLRTYQDTMRGGSLGSIVIPGDPDRSLLVHFIEGRRGKDRRMPQSGRPLSTEQIAAIRNWIAEGARDDGPVRPAAALVREDVPVTANTAMRILCRVDTPAYLEITARDENSGRILWSEVATVKEQREAMDAGEPGSDVVWNLRAAPGWPQTVTLVLRVYHAANAPVNVVLEAHSPD